ncbi:uncharacterized protein LOC143452171 [Clavelina lepadiformis]|uniref:uncharacterized protein LOC143452171 n=1 Tax=Clavelina lepadiformis TaxID=159417 RepID=UPI00404193A4
MSWSPFCQDFLNRYPNNIDYIWLGSPTYKWGSAGNERNVTLEEVKAQNRAGRYEGATLHGLQYKFLQGDDKISEYKARGKVVVIYNAHDFTMAVFGKDEVETGEYCRRSLLEAKYWLDLNGFH